jgi:deoxycytidylate deaminase
MGYNGFPAVLLDEDALYANRETKYSRIIHCEMNALNEAKQDVSDCTLYTWPFASCDRCFVHMLNAGLKRFVYPKATPEVLTRWGDALNKTKAYALEAGATMVELE